VTELMMNKLGVKQFPLSAKKGKIQAQPGQKGNVATMEIDVPNRTLRT
jgi:hypothetical protein